MPTKRNEFWPTLTVFLFLLAVEFCNVFRKLLHKEPWRFRRRLL